MGGNPINYVDPDGYELIYGVGVPLSITIGYVPPVVNNLNVLIISPLENIKLNAPTGDALTQDINRVPVTASKSNQQKNEKEKEKEKKGNVNTSNDKNEGKKTDKNRPKLSPEDQLESIEKAQEINRRRGRPNKIYSIQKSKQRFRKDVRERY